MCGIAGAFSFREGGAPAPVDEVRRMRDHMASRGPDGAGDWRSASGSVALGHRRLSIIDLSEQAAQPMVVDDVAITFNGEIYNYKELRRELEALGDRFRTQSDTEVLLRLYLKYGERMFDRISGMYAFALWDERKRALLLARDPFGIKPLYYCAGDDGVLRFASQVNGLVASGKVAVEPEPAAQVGFLLWGSVPSPWTFWRGVQALPAGHFIWVDSNGLRAPQAHCLVRDVLANASAAPTRCSRHDALDGIAEALRESIAAHHVSDVPVSLFLSSGIDSGLLAALSVEQGQRPAAITIAFDEFIGTAHDESRGAAALASQFGLSHRRITVGRKDFESEAKSLLAAMDQPTIDGINSWFISRAASQAGVKVALSGLGGDELFASYPSFRDIPRIVRAASAFRGLPGLGRLLRTALSRPAALVGLPKHAGLLEYGGSLEGAYLLKRGLFMPWELSRWLDKRTCAEGLEKLRTFESLRESFEGVTCARLAVSALEMTWYMRHQLLTDTDWASMAHSVEVRVPFLHLPLLKAAAPLLAAHPDIRKSEVAAHAARALPRDFLSKPKRGFSVPVRGWLQPRGGRPTRHGVRGWAQVVRRDWEVEHSAKRPAPAAGADIPTALWSPEMATVGGIQSYMWRLWEVLSSPGTFRQPATGLSLMDGPAHLSAYDHPSPARPLGASSSKVAFLLRAILHAQPGSVVVVGHLHHAPIALVARCLGRIGGYVVVLHGVEAWHRVHFFQRMALRNADRVIATTKFTATTCANANGLPSGNFHVIPLCADPRPALPQPGFRLHGDFPILFVARLAVGDRYKGLEPLMQATGQLQAAGIGAVLHVVGDGDDRSRLEQKARAFGVDGFVHFHGRLDDRKLQAAYNSARVFAMPSAKEGFGIVFLEAMRYGVPCVGGAHGGTPEVFRDGVEGFTVSYGDVDALATCLQVLASDDSHRLAIGDAGRRRFETDYTFAAFAKHWQRLLHEVHSRSDR